MFFLVFCRSKLTANVQQLGEVAVFQHQAFANINKFSIKQIPF